MDIKYFQKVGTVNYPNNYNFTRITEFKHLTGQKNDKTTIMKEFPCQCEKKDIPYYPIPKQEYEDLYNRYLEKSSRIENLFLLGRLAEYKYYNMDVIVKKSLDLFERIVISLSMFSKSTGLSLI